MSTDWGSATDANGARISLLHDDNTTTQPLSQSSSPSRHHPAAALPPMSPLLNVSYPGAAQTSRKRALNISTSPTAEHPYYAQPTSGSNATSPTSTTPGLSEYNSAPASQYSPRDINSALDPSLSSASTYAREEHARFSRPSSSSLPRDPATRFSAVGLSYAQSNNQHGYDTSPPRMSDRSYQSYMRRGDDLRRSESYGSASNGSLESEGPYTPREEDPSWRDRYRLSSEAYPSMLGKRPREEGEYTYQYPPPPPGPESEARYEEAHSAPYPYRADARAEKEYRPTAAPTYQYPPPAYGGKVALPHPQLLATDYPPSRPLPGRASGPGTPVQPEATAPSHLTGVKKFPCRFENTAPVFCQQTFTTSGHASRHAKIHREEKGIGCVFPGCEKRFTRGDNMKQHLETHYRVRGGRSKGKEGKGKREPGDGEGDEGEHRAEMQRLLREGAERRERERGEKESRRRAREGDVGPSASLGVVRGANGGFGGPDGERGVPPYYTRGSEMDALDALATVAVARK